MKTTLLSLTSSLLLSLVANAQSTAPAPGLKGVYQYPPVDSSANARPARPGIDYTHWAVGLGYQQTNGRSGFRANGGMAAFQMQGAQSLEPKRDRDGTLDVPVFYQGRITFVAGPGRMDSNNFMQGGAFRGLEFMADGFIGSTIRRRSAVRGLVGGSLHLQYQTNKDPHSQYSTELSINPVYLGAEGGLAYTHGPLWVSLTGFVGVAGMYNTLSANDVPVFRADQPSLGWQGHTMSKYSEPAGLARGGVGRLLIGDRLALNVLFMTVKKKDESSGDLVETTFYWNLGHKVSLIGGYDMFSSRTTSEIKNFSLGNQPVSPDLAPEILHPQTWKSTQFRVGIVRRFGR